MNPHREDADRVRAVRSAAAGWRRAGAIDGPTLRAILDLHPPVRREFGPVLTAVVFVASSVAICTTFGAFAVLLRFQDATAFGVLLLVGALGLVAAVEGLLASEAFGESGAASAAALWAALFAVAGVLLVADPRLSGSPDRIFLGAGAAAFAAAAWRWGWPLFAGASAFSLFLLLSGPFASRPLLAVLALGLAGGSVPFLDRADLPRSRRQSASAVLLVSLAWLYVLVNRFSVETRLVEELFGRHAAGEGSPAWGRASTFLTAAVPLAVLAWGLRSRRRAVLGIGVLMAALSLATLRYYVHVAPAWLVLAGAGAALVAGSALLERWLHRGPDRERRGFTAEPLFEDEGRQQALGIAVAAATLSPDAAPRPPEAGGSRFAGGGGDSGGGGSTESF